MTLKLSKTGMEQVTTSGVDPDILYKVCKDSHGWRPVDVPPPKEGYYLIYRFGGYFVALWKDGLWWYEVWQGTGWREFPFVSHWMKLPEPP